MTTPEPTTTTKTVSTPGTPSSSVTTSTTSKPFNKEYYWWILGAILLVGGAGWYTYDHSSTVRNDISATGTDTSNAASDVKQDFKSNPDTK